MSDATSRSPTMTSSHERLTPLRATLNANLTIRGINRPYRAALGKSVFEFVLQSHHVRLCSLARALFTRHLMVSGAIPILCAQQGRPVWWFVRAAPAAHAGRVITAFVRAIPRGHVAPAGCRSVNLEDWERQLAFRDLLPILPGLHCDLFTDLDPAPRADNREPGQ
jgi:hypothetical protein